MKREFVRKHAKPALEKYFSVEIGGGHYTLRESSFAHRDDPTRGRTTTREASPETQKQVMLAQAEYHLKRGYVELGGAAAAPAKRVRETQLSRWWAALDGPARSALADLLPETERSAPSDAALKELRASKVLDLRQRSLKDVNWLGAFTELRSLNLAGNPVPSELSCLAGLKKLETLWLAGTAVSDLKGVAALPSLKELGLNQTKLRSFEGIERWPKLELVQAAATKVTRVEPLAALSQLASLNISQTAVTTLEPLAHLMKLREVNAMLSKVRVVLPLAAVKSLQRLDVIRAKVTAGDVAEFERLRPGVLMVKTPR